MWPPPAGLNPKVWPSRGDPILLCGPPGVLNFLLWPLPWNRQPHRGIVLIFFYSLVLPLKGQSMKNVCMVEQYQQGLKHSGLRSALAWRKMLILRCGPHRGIDYKFNFFSEFEFILKTALGYGSGDWVMCFDEKNQRQNFLCQCPFTWKN